MFDEFTDAHAFADESEVGFQFGEGLDGGLGCVGAVEVPGQETGEVLDCAEGFVATDCYTCQS